MTPIRKATQRFIMNMKFRNRLIRFTETEKLKNMKIKNLEEKLLRSESEYAKQKLSDIEIKNFEDKIHARNIIISYALVGLLIGKML